MNELPKYRNSTKDLTIKKLKEDLKTNTQNNIWNSFFISADSNQTKSYIEVWKKKYLFPFGDITPAQENQNYASTLKDTNTESKLELVTNMLEGMLNEEG